MLGGMAEPLVSVLLPARDAAPTVERAARSILDQSLTALELVAVDDGSVDGTAGLLKELAARDRRVTVSQGGGRGLVHALNLGLSRCRGRYVARMDADDEALPRRLELSVRALEEDRTLAAVGTQVEIFREDRPVSPNMKAYERWLNALTTPERLEAERFVESPLCHPSVMLRREALERAGGWEEGDFPEDYQLWLRLLEAGGRLRAVEPVLLRWRDHEDRLTRKDRRYRQDALLALKARFLARTVLAAREEVLVWGAGSTGLKLARRLSAHGRPVAGFIEVSPRKIGRHIHGVPVVAPAALGPPGPMHLVAAVGAKGARDEIRAFLHARGWVEGAHFTCAA